MKADTPELTDRGDKQKIEFCLELIEAGRPLSEIMDAARPSADAVTLAHSPAQCPPTSSDRRRRTRFWLVCAAMFLAIMIGGIASLYRPIAAAEEVTAAVASAPIPQASVSKPLSSQLATSAETDALTERGNELLGAGDIAAARNAYERAAAAGNAQAAMYMALTYDPLFLKQARFGKAVQGNRETAEHWYRRAHQLRLAAQNPS